jgi:hypothetical protein
MLEKIINAGIIFILGFLVGVLITITKTGIQ